jgi:hypothetical protein
MPVATPNDVAAHVRRALTTEEQAFATTQIAAYTNMLEAAVKRIVAVQQFVETIHPIPAPGYASTAQNGYSTLTSYYGARVHLTKLPVQQVISVVAKPHWGADRDLTLAFGYEGPQTLVVPTYDPVEITYTAGDNPTHPLVTATIAKAVARDILTPAAAASGAMTNYSVEGTSVSYQGQAYLDQGAVGPFSGTEMRALRAALNRLVIR